MIAIKNGLAQNLKLITVAEAHLDLEVITKAGSIFKIEEIFPHAKRKGDLTVVVGNGKHGAIYGSYKGVFPSLMISSDIPFTITT